MPPRVGVKWADPHQPVYTHLGLQQAVHILAVHFEGHGLDAGAFAFEPVRHHGPKALAFGPAPDVGGHFSWSNGSRLYYANLTASFPSTGLIQNNQHALHLLLENTSVSENRKTGDKSPTVRFIDADRIRASRRWPR